MRGIALPLTVTLLSAALVSCGGDSNGNSKGEATLGGAGTQSRSDRYDARIASLKRKLRERQRQLATRTDQAGDQSEDSILARPDIASFDDFASGLGGQVGVTVGRVGDPKSVRLGSVATGKAWSTIKVALVARVLTERGGPEGLSPPDRDLIQRAITASDNSAAKSLFDGLSTVHGGISGASRAIEETLRQAGDDTTVVSTHGLNGFSSYGQTDWSLEEQHRFMAMLAARCVPDEAAASYLMELMGQVVPSQRWGIAAAGVPATFKGGWGPGPDGKYFVRQMGVLQVGKDHLVVVTAAALPDDGQFGTGQLMLSKVARWVVEQVDPSKVVASGC